MAISYVGGRTQAIAGATSGTTNVALTGLTGGSGSQPAAGDLVLVGYASGKTADQAISISGYTEISELYSNGSGADANLEVARKFMGGTPDTVVAVPNSGSTADAVAVSVRVYRGVDPTNPIDVAAVTASGTGTTNPNPGSITPATQGAWPVAFGAGAVAGTGTNFVSPDLAGFHTINSPDTNDATIGAGHKTDWSSGAFDPAAFTGGNVAAGNSWAAVTLALRPQLTQTHQGAAALAGAGSVAGTGRRQHNAAVAVTGAGTTSLAGRMSAAARSALDGAASITAAATWSTRARAAASGAGSMAAAAASAAAGAAQAVAAGMASLRARMTASGGSTVAGTGTLTASGSVAGADPPPPGNGVGIGIGIGL